MIALPLLLALAVQVPAATEIDRVVRRGVEVGIYPGAVVVIGTRRQVLHAEGYGHFTWSANSAVPDPDSTLWDLASLTKVVATTPALMMLVDAQQVELDAPVAHYLPDFRGAGKERVTVRQLLEHRSGLRAFLPLDERAESAREARRLVVEEPLRWPPGTRVQYSDLNAMLLGWIVEQVTGLSLDAVVTERFFTPAGMHRTRFRPSRRVRARVAPVGNWRGHVIAGEVHDQNAARLGGVSGHAGLYSTGGDLARYAQLLLNGGRTADGTVLFEPETVRRFTARGPGGRALGWEMRDTASSDDTGTLLSAAAFGHGGYTGTSIWIDPVRDVFIVLLTNRVYSPRTRRSISRLKEVRGTLADLAVRLRREVCGSPAAARVRRAPC